MQPEIGIQEDLRVRSEGSSAAPAAGFVHRLVLAGLVVRAGDQRQANGLVVVELLVLVFQLARALQSG